MMYMYEIKEILKYEDEPMLIYYLKPSSDLKNWLVELNGDGSICSIC